MPSIQLNDKPLPYAGVVDSLLQQIQSGQLQAGDKLLATTKLAEHYGVAVPTAHRALTELVKMGYIERKTGVGTFVRPPVSELSQMTIGAVIRCDGHIFADFTNQLLSLLGDLGVTTITVNAANLSVEEIADLPAYRRFLQDVPGTVIVQHAMLAEQILKVAPSAHVISIEAGEGHGPFDQVAPDPVAIGELAARHLLTRGHRRIDLAGIFIELDGEYRPSGETRQYRVGIDRALKEAGLSPSQLVDIRSGDDASERLVAYLRDPERASALVCTTAHRSAQLARLARESGIAIPQELALVSALDTPWAEAYELTAVDQGYAAVAELCVRLIRESFEGSRNDIPHRRIYRVAPGLVVRKST